MSSCKLVAGRANDRPEVIENTQGVEGTPLWPKYQPSLSCCIDTYTSTDQQLTRPIFRLADHIQKESYFNCPTNVIEVYSDTSYLMHLTKGRLQRIKNICPSPKYIENVDKGFCMHRIGHVTRRENLNQIMTLQGLTFQPFTFSYHRQMYMYMYRYAVYQFMRAPPLHDGRKAPCREWFGRRRIHVPARYSLVRLAVIHV